jgi:hypothetical protein
VVSQEAKATSQKAISQKVIPAIANGYTSNRPLPRRTGGPKNQKAALKPAAAKSEKLHAKGENRQAEARNAKPKQNLQTKKPRSEGNKSEAKETERGNDHDHTAK